MEQDPDSWLQPVIETIRECSAKLPEYEVQAIALSGHMSSPVFLDADCRPVFNCMTVGDARCEAEAEALSHRYEAEFRQNSGNKPMACFVAAKILWFQKHRPELYAKTAHMVMAKDYIRYLLTGRLNTDPTDAGNILLYDYAASAWNEELIELLGIRRELFPPVVDSMAQTGFVTEEMAERCGLGRHVAVFCGGADMACSHIGTASFEKNILAITLSTSGQVCATVDRIGEEAYGKVTIHPGIMPRNRYAMGSVFSGGLALNWYYEFLNARSELSDEDYTRMLQMSEASDRYMPCRSGILFLPFLSGSGSPYFRPSDRAAFAGISTATDREAMFAAVIEGVCFHILENIEVFTRMGCRFEKVHLSGGGSRNIEWIQVLSDVTGLSIDVLTCPDASATGAALIALAGSTGGNLYEIAAGTLQVAYTVRPRAERTARYRRLFPLYKKLYSAVSDLEAEMQAEKD